jgi:hypothetical protein
MGNRMQELLEATAPSESSTPSSDSTDEATQADRVGSAVPADNSEGGGESTNQAEGSNLFTRVGRAAWS